MESRPTTLAMSVAQASCPPILSGVVGAELTHLELRGAGGATLGYVQRVVGNEREVVRLVVRNGRGEQLIVTAVGGNFAIERRDAVGNTLDRASG